MLALAYVVMALGLNIIVGFAGLLDLGYVAFFAIGAYTIGWFGSALLRRRRPERRGHPRPGPRPPPNLPGIHLNFILVLIIAVIFTTIAGMLIGLPTLRLRGDYIAIVTLAFGEIIGRDRDQRRRARRINGQTADRRAPGHHAGRQDRPPVRRSRSSRSTCDPGTGSRSSSSRLVLFVNFRLRDSRLGRAWIALREDEVAAVSMGVPLVKTKLLAYGTGAAFGGISGRVPRLLPQHGQRRPVPVRVLDLRAGDGDPGRPGQHLGRRDRRDRAVVHQQPADPRRAQRRAAVARAGLRPHPALVRHLRFPARDHDDPASRGPAARAPAPDRAPRGRRRRRTRPSLQRRAHERRRHPVPGPRARGAAAGQRRRCSRPRASPSGSAA